MDWMGLDKPLLEGLALLGCVAVGCATTPVETLRGGAVAEATAGLQAPAAAPKTAVKVEAPTEIVLHAVGDCAIGDLHHGAGAPGSFAAEIAAADDPMGYPFSGVAELFAHDDLTIANLEGTFTDRKAWHNPVFSIRGAPENAQMLVRGGVELVDVENNHAFDYGVEGHEDTKAALEKVGVGYFGRDNVDRRTIKGMKIVNLGYLGGPKGTRAKMVADVARERGPSTIVIVSFHWGVEGYYATHPDQQRLGRAAIDAGASLVLGHHPHVVQGIETYRDRPIVYSMGNFVFGANSRPQDMDSFIYRVRFGLEGAEVASVKGEVIPVRISSDPNRNDFRPRLLQGAEAKRVVDKIGDLSAKLPAT